MTQCFPGPERPPEVNPFIEASRRAIRDSFRVMRAIPDINRACIGPDMLPKPKLAIAAGANLSDHALQ